MPLLRTLLLVSFFTLLLALPGGPLVRGAATSPARRYLEAGPRPGRISVSGPVLPLGGRPA